MDPRDVALQSTMPTVVVPLFGALEPLAGSGNRLLVAKDGLWIEAHRPGIYSRQKVAQQNTISVPYGTVTATLTTKFSHLGNAIREFVVFARESLPNEVGLALVWSDATNALEPRMLKAIQSGPSHMLYERPDPATGEHVVVDIHSHGCFPAFFSRTDDKDDKGDLKIAVVVGNVDQPQPTVKARLCTLGHYRPLPISIEENGLRINEGEISDVAAYLER